MHDERIRNDPSVKRLDPLGSGRTAPRGRPRDVRDDAIYLPPAWGNAPAPRGRLRFAKVYRPSRDRPTAQNGKSVNGNTRPSLQHEDAGKHDHEAVAVTLVPSCVRDVRRRTRRRHYVYYRNPKSCAHGRRGPPYYSAHHTGVVCAFPGECKSKLPSLCTIHTGAAEC